MQKAKNSGDGLDTLSVFSQFKDANWQKVRCIDRWLICDWSNENKHKMEQKYSSSVSIGYNASAKKVSFKSKTPTQKLFP